MRVLIFILILILISNQSFAGIPIDTSDVDHSKFSGRAYVISIGVDKYAKSKNNLLFCQSDADYFLKSLERDTTIREILKYTIRNDGTKEQLKVAFSEVTKNANKHDLFIFYYAGMSYGKSLGLTNEGLDYEEVFALSQNVFAERQIFISDASDGKQFGVSFKMFLEKKPLEKLSTKIDRVLLSLNTISFELPKGANLKDSLFAGGQLTGGISNSSFSLTSIFNTLNHSDKFWTEFKNEIYKTYKKESNFPDLFIFSEQDYLTEIKKESTRGVVVEINDKNIGGKIKKGETLAIIIGNQNFQKLSRLPNVMNDVTKINLLLNERYKTNTLLLMDISYQTFRDTINFIKEAYTFEEGSQLLFISASHGLKDNFGIGYLCFTDTKTDDNMATAYELLTLKRVISSFGATNTLMIMDICHSGLAFEENNCTSPTTPEIPLKSPIFTTPFNQSSPAYKNFLNQTSNFYFGSSRDQEAADGLGPNSPFATVIISFLENNKLPVIDSYHLKKSIEEKIMEEGAISFPTFCSYNCKPDGRFLFIRK
jgi:hypothetical protein